MASITSIPRQLARNENSEPLGNRGYSLSDQNFSITKEWPVSDYYHLGSTEAWQVYKGINGETNSTREAVEGASGQILSYNGGIFGSLYAATDEIVIEAHGGIGMSQHGANKLAAQGYDYLHILGAYYPGTGLASLEAEQ